jgi:hypothetical protein
MKVAPSSGKTSSQRYPPPPIPLDRPNVKELKKHESLTMKLRSDPADDNSQTYDLTIPFFRTGKPEEWLLFLKLLKQVLVGQNITAGPPKYAMTRRLIQGDTLTVFNNAAIDKGNETNANFELCLQDVTTHIFPKRALTHQKRFMRRHMKKPRDMPIRSFAARVTELNEYLKEFPPFDEDQGLDEDELFDIVEFGVPNSWQKSMILHGFKTEDEDKNMSELVEFCERHEYTEESYTGNENENSKKKAKRSNDDDDKKPSPQSSKNKGNKNEKFCDLHKQYGHSTAECKVVQAQIEKFRSSNWKTKQSDKDSKKSSTKASVMALIQKGVQDSMKQFLKNKKRKRDESNFNAETAEVDAESEANNSIDLDEFDDIVLSPDEDEESST